DHSTASPPPLDFADHIRQPVPARATIRIRTFDMIVDDDIRSLAGEPGRDGAADAVFAARARHQSDFPTERVHTSILSFSRTFQRGEEKASKFLCCEIWATGNKGHFCGLGTRVRSIPGVRAIEDCQLLYSAR